MSLAGHLIELRKRITYSAIAIVVATVAAYIWAVQWVFVQLQQPIDAVAKAHNATINYTVITEAFDVNLQIAFTVGILVSSPIWLYQVWAFVIPALVRRERLYALGFFFAAVPLFLGGAAAGWFLFPHMAELLLGFAQSETSTVLSAKYLIDFVTKLVIGVGIGFVFPVFLVLLNFVGIISARSILKGWRIAIVVIAVFTAFVTPSADVLSMFLLAIPMVVLYFAAALVAWLHDRGAAKRADALDAELATS